MVSVRLDDEHSRKVRELQKQGVSLSDIVWEAIDQRYEALKSAATEDPVAIMKRIYEMFPDPPDAPLRAYDVHDRKQARAAILGKLNRARR